MPDKQKEYQRIHKQYEDMPGSLNAAEQKQEALERNRRLPEPEDAKYLMDAEQLRDYYEERNRDTEENSFRIRTKYYFEDFHMADAKAHRYRALADNEQMVENYAQRHGGRRAYKRKGDAGTAAKKFREMQRLMVKQRSKNQDNLTPLQKYNQREEVMKLRMEGMVAAAQLKSKPGNMHHLVARAQYSCFMVLKDQLTHLVNEQQSARDKRMLTTKLKEVNTRLMSLFKDLKKYTPSVQKQWQEEQFNNIQYETAKREYQADCPINVVVSKETGKTLFHLQKFHEKYGNVQWPSRCVYKTKEGDAPINPAERKMQEWNNRVEAIREHGSDYAKRRVEEEGIKIFMNTELPSAQTLKTMGTKYLEDNLRTFYEMTHIALPYYRREIEKGKGFLFNYAEDNHDFQEKLDYVEAIRNYMDYRLQKNHGIRTDKEKGYAINTAGAGYGELLSDMAEQQLERADINYGIYVKQEVNKFDLMPEIPTNAMGPLLADEEEQEEPEEEVHEIRQAQPIVQPEEKEEPKNEIIEEKKEEIKEEPKNEIIEEKKEEIKEEQKDEIIEEKKEQIKEEPKDEIIVEKKEEIKEELKNVIIEEKKKEEKKEDEIKDEQKNVIIEKIEEDDGDGPLVEDSKKEEEKGSLADAYAQLQTDLEKLQKEELQRKAEEDRKNAKIQEEIRRRNEELEKARKFYEERRKMEAAKREEEKQQKDAVKEDRIVVYKKMIDVNKILAEPKNEIKKPKNENKEPKNSINEIKINEIRINIDEDQKDVINEIKISKEPKNEIKEPKNEEKELKNSINEIKINENKINENKINLINENRINENRIIVDDEAPVKMIQNAGELLAHAEYQKLLGDAEAVFAKYKVEEEEEETTQKAKEGKEKIQKKKTQEKNAKEAIASMMRLVHFDEDGAPVTREDKENHAWNLKWLTAWKEDQFDVREKMISEELNRIADQMIPLPKTNVAAPVRELLEQNDFDFINGRIEELEARQKTKKLGSKEQKQLTELTVKKKAFQEAMTAFRQKLNEWSRTQFEENGNDSFMAALHKMRALSNLDMAHPALRTYCEKNKAFDSYRQVMEVLSAYLERSESKKKAGESKEERTDKLNSLALSVMKKTWQYMEHEADSYAPYISKGLAVMETKKEQEEEFHKDALAKLGLKEGHFAPKLDKNHKKELESAKSRYEVWKYYKGLEKYENCQEYQDLFQKTGSKNTMGRSVTAIMKPVQFDKNNKPLPRYKENHEWNLKWLKVLVDKDEKERDRMVEEYYPHSLDEVEDKDFPEVKLTDREFATMRSYAKAVAEYEAQKKKLDEMKEKIRAKDEKADFQKYPTYRKLKEEQSKILKRKSKLLDEAEVIAKKYAAGKDFKKWAANKLKDRSDHGASTFLRSRAQGSVDALEKICPFVREYERRNPRFSKKAKMLERIGMTFANYVKNNYGVETIGPINYSKDWTEDEDVKNGTISDSGSYTLVEYITQWMEYNNVGMQDKAEDDAELARLKKENASFTVKDFEYYKKLKAVKELTINKTYMDIDLTKTKEKYGLTKHDSLDRFANVCFKPVQFDRRNQPVSKEDQENHEWNLKWMRAWEKDDVNTREEMIGEMLPHLYDKIKIPEFNLSKEDRNTINQAIKNGEDHDEALRMYEACKDETQKKQLEKILADARKKRNDADDELEKLTGKYAGIVAKWAEEIEQNKDMEFVQTYLCSLSIDKLQKIHPSVARFFEGNPALRVLSRMVDIVGRIFSTFVLTTRHCIRMSDGVKLVDEYTVQNDKQEYMERVSMEVPQILKHLVKYDQLKKKKEPFVSLSSNEGYLANEKEKKEYLKLWKKQPLLTQRGYSLYKTRQRAKAIDFNKEYNELYKEAKGVFKEFSGGISLSRDATLIMRHVEVDEKGIPLTEQDEKNHQWNLQWLKALDEDDFELREKMIAEEIPNRFQIRDLPKPSEKLLKLHQKMKEVKKKGLKDSWNGKREEQEYRSEYLKFQKELEDFTEKKIDDQDVTFFEEMQRGLSLDVIRKMHPSIQQYLDNNPEIGKRNALLGTYGNLHAGYASKKYLVEASTDVKVTELTGDSLKKARENMQMMEDVHVSDYLDKYLDYQKVENEPYVSFKPLIREEDKGRKERRKAFKAEEKRKAQEEEAKQKKYEPLIREIQKINPSFNPSFYEPIARTDVRGKTFQNKEYLALARQVTMQGFGNELNGPMSFCLETVEMDEEGNVLSEYKDAHQRNLEWLNLLVKTGKEDHQKEIQKKVLQEAEKLVKTFPLPDWADISGMGAVMKFIREPEKMKTRIQKLQAYQKILKNCPEVAVSGEENQKVTGHINLLLEAMPLLLTQNRMNPGIDYSGDQFKAIKPLEMTDEELEKYKKQISNYVKARDNFVKPPKQKKK